MFLDRFFNKAYDRETLDRIKFLSNIFIFKGIKRKDLLYILENLYEGKYAKGETIFLKGDVGKALFIVYRGRIGLYDSNEDKNLVVEVKEGEFVGEMALLEEMPRTMCARALQDSILFMLYRVNLENMMRSKPHIASIINYNLACVLSARLRSLLNNE